MKRTGYEQLKLVKPKHIKMYPYKIQLGSDMDKIKHLNVMIDEKNLSFEIYLDLVSVLNMKKIKKEIKFDFIGDENGF